MRFSFLAVAIAFGGAEDAGHLRVIDVDQGRLLEEDLPRIWAGSEGGVGSIWLPDNRSFAYLQFPHLEPGQSRQERLLRSRTYSLSIIGFPVMFYLIFGMAERAKPMLPRSRMR